jgi:hypothetical protein
VSSKLLVVLTSFKGSRAFGSVTPPLLPLTPPLTPFSPSESAGNLELLSDHIDPTIAEAQALGESIVKQDSITMPRAGSNDSMLLDSTDAFAQIYSPIRSLLISSSATPPRKRKVYDLKVEVPLSPSNQAPTTPAKKVKSVSFPEGLLEYIPGTRAMAGDIEDTATNSQASFDTFFDQVIEPFAAKANQSIEQEQLHEADSLLRVTVPIMDSSQPTVPWKFYARKANGKYRQGETQLMAQQKLLFYVKKLNLKMFTPWRSVLNLERHLQWTAIPRELAKIELDESLDDAPYMALLLNDMGLEDVVISDSLTWKPDGLRMLDDLYESENELEFADAQEEELEHVENLAKSTTGKVIGVIPASGTGPISPKRQSSIPKRTCEETRHTLDSFKFAISDKMNITMPEHKSIFGGGMLSVSNALSNFMISRGKLSDVPEAIHSLHPEMLPKATCTKQSLTPFAADEPPTATCVPGFDKISPRSISSIPENPEPRSFIISTALLRNQRSLMRIIRGLYKNAIYVERDFAALPSAIEADMLLSPTTGIVLTTLQKIKQRPLPGQRLRADRLQERLSDLSARYERVLLFVHEGVAATKIPKDLDQRDCDALTELKWFTHELEADTQVVYVPGGDEELGSYVVSYMLRYGSLRNDSELEQEDTLVTSHPFLIYPSCPTNLGIQWEQNFRRAGFNSFAAQVILANLTRDLNNGIEYTSSSDPLLSSSEERPYLAMKAFDLMSHEERSQRFAQLLGGTRILDRVGSVLK